MNEDDLPQNIKIGEAEFELLGARKVDFVDKAIVGMTCDGEVAFVFLINGEERAFYMQAGTAMKASLAMIDMIVSMLDETKERNVN